MWAPPVKKKRSDEFILAWGKSKSLIEGCMKQGWTKIAYVPKKYTSWDLPGYELVIRKTINSKKQEKA